jgi:hypothetical protein
MAGYIYTMIIQVVITGMVLGFLVYWNLHHLLAWV